MTNRDSVIDKFRILPISEVAEEVCASLAETPRLILTSPPGTGKSTLIPLILLNSLPEGKILMLEPRRIAARQVAMRMASMLGEEIGGTVGYRVRFDTRVSASTRIEVITEGIMERMLIEDPTLECVSAVIFDEFHERNLSSDLSLALVREIQNVLRPDVRILIMSATIDATSLSEKLEAVHIDCPGKNHEVKIIYGEDFDPRNCAMVVARTINQALRNHKGNILAFLPGQAEIMKCKDLLSEIIEDVDILTLYGMMPQEQQNKVMIPSAYGRRRVVLATPIAETSLTIEGIEVVVDSGLYRAPVFDLTSGLSRLTTRRISMDMAVQRSGRAGRLGPGVCYRLWSKPSEAKFKATREPEILTADLAPSILNIASWGESDPLNLPWITFPPKGNVENGRQLLRLLGAIDEGGRLTEKGKKILQLPCHPRIAVMLTEAGVLKCAACDIAAILEERDPFKDENDADITTRLELLEQSRRTRRFAGWKRINDVSEQYRKLLKISHGSNVISTEIIDPEEIGKLIAKAYPERIAMRDDKGKYKLSAGGELVSLNPDDDLARHEFLAVASVGNRILSAAPIDRCEVERLGSWKENIVWNSKEGRVTAQEELCLGTLVIATRQITGKSRDAITSAVVEAVKKDGLSMFDFNEEVKSLQLRIAIVSDWHPEFGLPDASTEAILSSAGDWLPMYIGSATNVQELRKINLQDVVTGLLTYQQQTDLERVAPTSIKLPSGRNVKIRYRKGAEVPVVSARIQDCFGLLKTPTIDEGKRKVLMELLSPGFKPVQLTQDMEGFWKDTYFEIRKELRRRYPKHNWPENPLSITQ